jgi:hypothetical protein
LNTQRTVGWVKTKELKAKSLKLKEFGFQKPESSSLWNIAQV